MLNLIFLQEIINANISKKVSEIGIFAGQLIGL